MQLSFRPINAENDRPIRPAKLSTSNRSRLPQDSSRHGNPRDLPTFPASKPRRSEPRQENLPERIQHQGRQGEVSGSGCGRRGGAGWRGQEIVGTKGPVTLKLLCKFGWAVWVGERDSVEDSCGFGMLAGGRGRKTAGGPGIFRRDWGGKCCGCPRCCACPAAFWEKCHRDASG